MESLAVSERSHPAPSPCSLQPPGENPLSLQLCPSLGSLFPDGAPSRGGLGTPASLCGRWSPPLRSPGCKRCRSVPAVTLAAPHMPDICMGGRYVSQGTALGVSLPLSFG